MAALEIMDPELDWGRSDMPDLHERLNAYRKNGPIARINWFGAPGWIVYDYPEVLAGFLDDTHFNIANSYRQGATISQGERMLGALEGQDHRLARRIVNAPFGPKQIRQKLESVIEPVAHELLDRIEGEDEVDFLNGFCRVYPFAVISRMLGIPAEDEERLLPWTQAIFGFMWDPEAALAAREEFDAFMAPILDDRRAHPRDDVISYLLAAETEGEKLDLEAIRCFLRSIFPAGSDSTFMSFSSMMAVLLTDPAVRAKAMSGADGVHAVVAETLRWQPPFANFPRICSEDATIAGAHIKKGEWVLFSTTGANSDPKRYPDPRRFDPNRPEADIITFGKGAHYCVGAHLARIELEAALRIVLQRFPDMKLAPGCEIEFNGVIFRHVRELRVLPYGERGRKARRAAAE